MRYLVTGVAGFVGSHLAEALVAEGHEVIGIDGFTDYYARELKEANLACVSGAPAFSLLELDLSTADIRGLVADSDGVFHLAAQPGVRASWGASFDVYARDNVLATQRVFEAAANAGVRVVYASSSSIYGDAETFPTAEDVRPVPISPYGVTKAACELLAESYARSQGLSVAGMRYFTVYGPRQRPDMAFARIVAALVGGTDFTILGSGEQSRDFTYVDDAVAATIAAMETVGESRIYNVGGGAEATLNEVIVALEDLAGRKLRALRQDAFPGDVTRTAADTCRIRQELGWVPRISLQEGLSHHLDWEIERNRVGPREPARSSR